MSDFHKHPISGIEIKGTRLPAGTILQNTDRYDSTIGKWEKCPTQSVGESVPEGDHVIWIRPV